MSEQHSTPRAIDGLRRSAAHDVLVTVEERTYEVLGADERMLERVMELRGPRRGGRVFVAFTDWEVRWARTADGPRVRFQAVVTLPEWRAPRFYSEHLCDRWRRFREAVAVHERGHVEIGIAAAEAVAAALGDARWPPEAWPDIDRVVAPFLDRERQYDADTRHGAAQGAVLRSAVDHPTRFR